MVARHENLRGAHVCGPRRSSRRTRAGSLLRGAVVACPKPQLLSALSSFCAMPSPAAVASRRPSRTPRRVLRHALQQVRGRAFAQTWATASERERHAAVDVDDARVPATGLRGASGSTRCRRASSTRRSSLRRRRQRFCSPGQEYTELAVHARGVDERRDVAGRGCSTRPTTCASSPSRCSRRAAGRCFLAARTLPFTAPASALCERRVRRAQGARVQVRRQRHGEFDGCGRQRPPLSVRGRRVDATLAAHRLRHRPRDARIRAAVRRRPHERHVTESNVPYTYFLPGHRLQRPPPSCSAPATLTTAATRCVSVYASPTIASWSTWAAGSARCCKCGFVRGGGGRARAQGGGDEDDTRSTPSSPTAAARARAARAGARHTGHAPPIPLHEITRRWRRARRPRRGDGQRRTTPTAACSTGTMTTPRGGSTASTRAAARSAATPRSP